MSLTVDWHRYFLNYNTHPFISYLFILIQKLNRNIVDRCLLYTALIIWSYLRE